MLENELKSAKSVSGLSLQIVTIIKSSNEILISNRFNLLFMVSAGKKENKQCLPGLTNSIR